MMKAIFIIALLIPIESARAGGPLLFDQDTAALVQLVSNSASTVSNTMDILKVARKTGQKIDYYNNLALRQYFKARRTEQNILDLAETAKMRPRSLRELNGELLKLKANIRGLKDTIDSVALDIWQVDNFTERQWEKLANSKRDEQEFYGQELQSANEGPTKNHIQNTAMNTAMSGKVLTKMRRDNLEYQRIDLRMKRNAAAERLRQQQAYEEWLK